jgi:EAL and modified HD-GYP domain-containing signal transduction protein
VGLFSFLKSKPEPQAAAVAPSAEAAPAAQAVALLTRAQIVDQRLRLSGYRFSAALPEPARLQALAAAGVAAYAQQRLALIALSPAAALAGAHLPLLAPQTTFLLDCRAPHSADALAALRGSGCRVALCGVRADDLPLLAQCDLVVLALNAQPLAELQALTRQIRLTYPELALLVDGVDAWDEQRMCASWGCSYFMGQFLTTPDQVADDARIDQSRMTSIELLNLLRTDAELPAMIEVAKRDPGMTYQVLQWANAPGSGSSAKVTSLQQAFMVLGRKQLYRALTVSMFRLGGGASKERDESLLEVALTRARFLETCSGLPQAGRDELFLVGLLSLFDVLLGVPMAQLLDKMQLSDAIRNALLGGDSAYTPYLTMVLLLQRDKVAPALEIAQQLGLDVDGLAVVGQAAFEWAQESVRHTGAE